MPTESDFSKEYTEPEVAREHSEERSTQNIYFFEKGPRIYKKSSYKTTLTRIQTELSPDGTFTVKALHHGSLRSEGAGWVFRANFLDVNKKNLGSATFYMGISCWDNADGLLETSGSGKVEDLLGDFPKVHYLALRFDSGAWLFC